MTPAMKADEVTQALATRAFCQGFSAGADLRKRMGGHIVDPATHAHWRRGFLAGREAALAAEQAYAPEVVCSE